MPRDIDQLGQGVVITQPSRDSAEAECYCVRWTVVRTHSQAERWAAANLRRQGYTTYLPTYAALVRDRVTPSMRRMVEKVLFPGYCFVQHDSRDSWGPIRDTPGVKSVLRCGNRIQYARAGAVEALQAGDAARHTLMRGEPRWRPGAACRLVGGAFDGQDGVVVAVERDTARVAMVMFGALREVSVGLDALGERDGE